MDYQASVLRALAASRNCGPVSTRAHGNGP
jgi:hypothetical protein